MSVEVETVNVDVVVEPLDVVVEAITASGPQGPQGPQGPAGADSTVPGPQGPQGPAGADSTVPGPAGPAGANGAGTINGTGSPEGVRAATVGTIYVDTAATTGAVAWVKATGAGNTGWKVLYGDTGWRNVTASLAGLDAANAGTLSLRRVDTVVYWRFSNLLMAAGSGTVSLWTAIPSGFRALNLGCNASVNRNNSAAYAECMSANTTLLAWIAEISLLTGGGTITHPSVGLTGAMSHITDDAWPATLPGS